MTWRGTPQSFNGISLSYFYEKLLAYEGEKEEFDSKKAKEDIDYYFKEYMLEEYYSTKEDREDDIQDIKEEIKNLDKNDENYLEDIKDLKEELFDIEQDLNELKTNAEYKPIFILKDKLFNIADNTSSVQEWIGMINGDYELTRELSDYYYDFWSWIYGIGTIVPPNIELYLAGLNMAAEQLEKINVKEKCNIK